MQLSTNLVHSSQIYNILKSVELLKIVKILNYLKVKARVTLEKERNHIKFINNKISINMKEFCADHYGGTCLYFLVSCHISCGVASECKQSFGR